MPFHPIQNTAKLEVLGHDDLGIKTVNVLHLSNLIPVPGGSIFGSVADATTAAQRLFDSWKARILPLTSAHWALDQVRATDMSTVSGSQGVYAVGAPFGGALSGDALPPGVSLCIALYSDFRGRQGRGRLYLAGLAESQNDPAGAPALSLQTAAAAAVQAIDGDMRGLLGVNLYGLSVAHGDSSGGHYHLLNHVVARQNWRYQRRRSS